MQSEYGMHLQDTAVVTICTGDDFVERLKQCFTRLSWDAHFSDYEGYLSAERRPALSALRSARACIAFVDFDQQPDQAVETVRYLTGVLGSKITIVAVSMNVDPALMLTAMRAGCKEFVPHDASPTQLLETLDQLERRTPAAAPQSVQSGSIISFFGAKGGVGTTTLCVHIAMYLAKYHQKRVLLIDYHAELGHVCVYLGLDGSRYHFQEVARNVGRLDSELLRGFVAQHASGLEVLSSPDICGGMKPMDLSAVARTLEFLRGEYDYVLLDCVTPTTEMSLPVIEASTLIYLVTTPEVGAVRDLSRYVDTFSPSDGFSDKLHIVVNRSSSPYAIEVAQIEKAMKLPVAIKIASNYGELVRADNLGEPLLVGTHSEIAGQLMKWTNSLVGTSAMPAPTKASKGVFALFR